MGPENLVCLYLVRSSRDEVSKTVTAFSKDCFVEEILSVLGIALNPCFFWTSSYKKMGDCHLNTGKVVFCGFFVLFYFCFLCYLYLGRPAIPH